MDCRRGLANSICLSVRLLDERLICDKTKESCACILIPHERPFNIVLCEEEWLVGGPLLPEILGQPALVGAKSPILNRCSLVAPQP